MTFEVASIRSVENGYIETEVSKLECIDMHAVLIAKGMWLILEGFENGYVTTETGVDRLHVIIHDTIQPESAVIELNTLVQEELATLFN